MSRGYYRYFGPFLKAQERWLNRMADRGLRLDWDTQLEGDVIVGDYFVLGEEDAVCSGRITFTVRRA